MNEESKNKSLNELFNLLTKEAIAWLTDFMQSNPEINKDAKNLCTLNQRDKNNVDPLVNLEVDGFCIKQVVLYFGSKRT